MNQSDMNLIVREEFNQLRTLVSEFVTFFTSTSTKQDDTEDEDEDEPEVEVMLAAMAVAVKLGNLEGKIDGLLQSLM